MGGPVCNTTLEDSHIHEDPILHNLTFHQIGLIITALFGLIAVGLSSWLVFMHATHYSRPFEQKHIMRVLFMVPIYSIVSFLSFMFYRNFIYYQVLMECYEAFAIASFFTLLCHYIGPNLHEQKEYFRSIHPQPWVWPLDWMKRCCGGERGIWRTPRSGLTWFNIIWLGVFQYCFIRVFMTIVSVSSQTAGRYCEASLHPAFAHVWVMVFVASSVTVAMYCLIQFYVQLKDELAAHRPLFKVVCIKLVIFFSFWQSITISFLTSTGMISPGARINYADYKVGIPNMLLVIEMAVFSLLHIYAFPWSEYRVSKASEFYSGRDEYQGGRFGSRALRDAYNPWDMVKAVGRAAHWLFVGIRRRELDESYRRDGGHQAPNDVDTRYTNLPLNATAVKSPTTYPYAASPLSASSHSRYAKNKTTTTAAAAAADDDDDDNATLLPHSTSPPYTLPHIDVGTVRLSHTSTPRSPSPPPYSAQRRSPPPSPPPQPADTDHQSARRHGHDDEDEWDLWGEDGGVRRDSGAGGGGGGGGAGEESSRGGGGRGEEVPAGWV
ncbi:MAG: hypothetical protein M1833_002912 [Piccolia ochrophora]|nr:MAG: hypothetical protein M1833_002912 [Piccolia ochrophora]